jgi:hypothetical protein
MPYGIETSFLLHRFAADACKSEQRTAANDRTHFHQPHGIACCSVAIRRSPGLTFERFKAIVPGKNNRSHGSTERRAHLE